MWRTADEIGAHLVHSIAVAVQCCTGIGGVWRGKRRIVMQSAHMEGGCIYGLLPAESCGLRDRGYVLRHRQKHGTVLRSIT